MPAELTERQKREIRNKRRKQRKRKKIILLIRAIIRLLILTTALVLVCKLLISSEGEVMPENVLERENFSWQKENETREAEKDVFYILEADANLSKPVEYEKNEIRKRLEKLARENKAYQDICENWERYPEELLGALCNNEEMLPFVQGYLENDGQAHGELSEEEKAAKIPLLMQWDERWGYVPYGDACIAVQGCAPTSIAMVTIGLTEDYGVTPDVVAKYALEEGYYVEGTGTAWSLMTEGCEYFGLRGQEISLDEAVMRNHLLDGEYIICSMRPGNFTTQGHFIVITGVKDGGFTVHDANSRERSQVIWSYETLKGQIKNLWAFSEV